MAVPAENAQLQPPPFHSWLTNYGERPYFSPDGTRIAFIAENYGDAHEVDLATGAIRPLTDELGEHHSFLRVLYLSNGDYLLIGPAEFDGDRDRARHVESELWILDRALQTPPVRLGRRIFEGAGVSTIRPRITYAVNGRQDPSLGGNDVFECHVTEIEYGPDGPYLGEDTVFYRTRGGRAPEPQDFRHDDTEVIFAEYHRSGRNPFAPEPVCTVRGYQLTTGTHVTYVEEARVHNECEGIFPDHDYMCLESDCDSGFPPRDLWKLALDGSGRRARMTAMPRESDWRATNSNVSPDGETLAFMLNRRNDEAGLGRGIGLLDLRAWEASNPQWENPTSRVADQLPSYPYPNSEPFDWDAHSGRPAPR